MRQQKSISQLVALLLGKVRGTLSATQRKEYQDMLGDEQFAKLDKQFEQPQFVVEKLVQHSQFDPHVAFKEFQRKTSSQRQRNIRYRFISIAAAAVIVIGVLTVLVVDMRVQQERRENTMAQAKEVMPGSKRAQITLANGQVIELSDSALDMKVDGIGTVKSEGGKITYNSTKSDVERPAAKNQVKVPRGGECVIVLDDGTKVWLNSESMLEYPVKFTGRERRVRVEGEVLFDVTHNEQIPFIVESPHITLTVRGTTFNVRDYADESQASASLVSGRVEVDNGDHTSKLVLMPGYQVVCREGSATLNVKKIDPGVVTGWTENKFAFWQQDLRDVLADVSRWYDIKVEYATDYTGQYSLTGKIPRSCRLDEVLEMLEMITDATFIFYDNTLTVRGKTQLK